MLDDVAAGEALLAEGEPPTHGTPVGGADDNGVDWRSLQRVEAAREAAAASSEGLDALLAERGFGAGAAGAGDDGSGNPERHVTAPFRREPEPEAYEPENMTSEERGLRKDMLGRIVDAARRAKPAIAEEVLADMGAQGVWAGVEAHHACVVAHVLDDKPQQGLAAAWRAHDAGVRLPQETYLALIRGFAAKGDVPKARAVSDALAKAGHNDNAGWCALALTLLRSEDFVRDGIKLVKQGMNERQRPSAPLMLLYLREVGKANWQHAMKDFIFLYTSGVDVTIDHANEVLQAIVTYAPIGPVMTRESDRFYQSMCAPLGPNAETFAIQLQAAVQAGGGYDVLGVESMMRVNGLRKQLDGMGVVPNMRWHRQLMVASLRSDLTDQAMQEFRWLRAAPDAALAGRSAALESAHIAMLLQALALGGLVEELAHVVHALVQDGAALPEALMQEDDEGRTIATRWLGAPNEEGTGADTAGFIAPSTGKRGGAGNAAAKGNGGDSKAAAVTLVGLTGKDILEALTAASKLKLPGLKEELEAIGMQSHKLRKENYDQVKRNRELLKVGGLTDEQFKAYAIHAGLVSQEALAQAEQEAAQGEAERETVEPQQPAAGADGAGDEAADPAFNVVGFDKSSTDEGTSELEQQTRLASALLPDGVRVGESSAEDKNSRRSKKETVFDAAAGAATEEGDAKAAPLTEEQAALNRMNQARDRVKLAFSILSDVVELGGRLTTGDLLALLREAELAQDADATMTVINDLSRNAVAQLPMAAFEVASRTTGRPAEELLKEAREAGLVPSAPAPAAAAGEAFQPSAGPEPKAVRKTTAFGAFVADVRPQVKRSNPQLSSSQLDELLAQLWTELSDEEMEPYLLKAGDGSAAGASEPLGE